MKVSRLIRTDNRTRDHPNAIRFYIAIRLCLIKARLPECFRSKVPKMRIDASLEHLLASTPPKSSVQGGQAQRWSAWRAVTSVSVGDGVAADMGDFLLISPHASR